MSKRTAVSIVFAASMVMPAAAFAQQQQGYVFGSVGAAASSGYVDATTELGGGWEGLIKNRFGVGTELTRAAPLAEPEYGIWLWSINGTAHLPGTMKSPRIRPFVTGGVTFALADGLYPLANFGGGVETWINRRVGLRVEGRDVTDGGGHLLGARFGLVFRGKNTRP